MNFQSKYTAIKPDSSGYVNYSDQDHQVWHDLITRQRKIIKNRACNEYIEGIDKLNLVDSHIPQCKEINKALLATTGWQVEAVEALIPVDYFFQLLTERKFPAATFIRRREELDYLQEPDIFHEIFGHCPMLTHKPYADFMQKYGEIALTASEEDRAYLGRLYWFTVEFGLIKTSAGNRCYGGGILSSKEETIYAIESDVPQRTPLAGGMNALRTPYRIDILQPSYFIINSFDELYQLINNNILDKVHQAQKLGEFKPLFNTD